ncbi:MAG: GNAT family N-acetyltransferase [Variibacter sp.]
MSIADTVIVAAPAVAADAVGVRADVLTRAEVEALPVWRHAFAGQRKDSRYYALVEDTIHPEFRHRYCVVRDVRGEAIAVQPFFILDQDILAGSADGVSALVARARKIWPRFLTMRTVMVGSVAGEGHLDDDDHAAQRRHAPLIAQAITDHAKRERARLIVFKEFPAKYRDALAPLVDMGFTRVPSMPMTKLNIEYKDFEDYTHRCLNGWQRRDINRKFRQAAKFDPIAMEVVDDLVPYIDEIYPLYLAVYQRSKLHFEKLNKEFFLGLAERMPDKTRFFLWRQNGKIVAFTFCMVEGDAIYGEYIGFDYDVAIKLHLYHQAFRDIVNWAIANGYKWFRSSGLNYDPKLHLRHVLDPLDLYVKHTSPLINFGLARALPYLEPTHNDKTLPKFENYKDLWG